MAIRCPQCKKEYDITLFEFDKNIICDCGYEIKLQHKVIIDELEKFSKDYFIQLEEDNIKEVQRASEEIVNLILYNDIQKIDVEIEKEKFKELIKKLFPENLYIYSLIYEPRFKRLWKQFRDTD